MDPRAEKLAKARKKLKDHQEKKVQKDLTNDRIIENIQHQNLGSSLDGSSEFIIEPTNDDTKEHNINDNISIKQNDFCEHRDQVSFSKETEGCINEYFVLNQQSLEHEMKILQQKLADLEFVHTNEHFNHNIAKQKISTLETEVKNLVNQNTILTESLHKKEDVISKLTIENNTIKEENKNYSEQLELTKTMLTSKESDNSQLYNQLCMYAKQLESYQLQIQQLNSNHNSVDIKHDSNNEEIEQMREKIDNLNKKIASLQQEKDNIIAHYQHYMNDLREQLNTITNKNEELSKEVERLSDREAGLIEQIGEMEIRIQKFNKKDFEIETQVDTSELQRQIISLQSDLEENKKQNKELQEQLNYNIHKIQELEQKQSTECDHAGISLEKLTADMASDKIAAQKATEQNIKLKNDINELEQVVVKMTKDKLDLTEMLTHEKNLTKELMLKLADIEERGKNVQNNLKAKDDEMIRLQNECRELTKKYNDLLENYSHNINKLESSHTSQDHVDEIKSGVTNSESYNNEESNRSEQTTEGNNNTDLKDNVKPGIPKEDAMMKLQERFMRIMDEVANLSDEKHRLEHIILQLQNETDTICEYVALYQQQRSLLKKRDEERTHQLKMFEKECNELKDFLAELRQVLFRLAEDKEISHYLKTEGRVAEIARIQDLMEKLQNSSLINKKFSSMDLNSFYPCSCCSGKLIDI